MIQSAIGRAVLHEDLARDLARAAMEQVLEGQATPAQIGALAAARREIGVRTVFNVLGPLTNPAGARRQLLGVYDDELVLRVAEVLRELGSERAWVVHGRDGLDELTVFAKSHVAELSGGRIHE